MCQKPTLSVDQVLSITDMIWETEECGVSKNIELKTWRQKFRQRFCSAFVYFANFLLQLKVVLIICALVDGFSSFQIVFARFRLFQLILARFSSFLILVSTKQKTIRENQSLYINENIDHGIMKRTDNQIRAVESFLMVWR